jgi:prophage regulatory protein
MKQNVSTLRKPPDSDSNADVQPARRSSKLDLLPLKLLRFDDVQERTGLSRSTIWRLEHRGVFPKRVQVSANVVAWLEDEVVAWIQARVERVAV